MSLDEIEAEITRLRLEIARRERLTPANDRPPRELLAFGDMAFHRGVLTKSRRLHSRLPATIKAIALRRDGSLTEISLNCDGVRGLGDNVPVGTRYFYLTGIDRADHICHLMPWVKVVDSITESDLYPCGFTLNQLCELEWGTYSLVTETSYSTTDIAQTERHEVLNRYRNGFGFQQPLPDVRYLHRRGGLKQVVLHEGYFNEDWPRLSLVRCQLIIGPQVMDVGLDGYPRPFFPPRETIEVAQDIIGSDVTRLGTRILYMPSTGLFYPAMFLGITAGITAPEGADQSGDCQQLYSNVDIYGQEDVPVNVPSGLRVSINGSWPEPWTLYVQMKTSGLVGPGAFNGETASIDAFSIRLNHWAEFGS